MKRTKCQILNCVFNILPPSLRAEAKRICDLAREKDRIWINDKKEVILDGRVIPKSNICTLIIEKLRKYQSPVNTKQYEKENELLKYLLAYQKKALERERGVLLCKILFDGTVEHFDDSSNDTDDGEEEDSEEDEEDCHDEDNTDETEDYEDDGEYDEDDEEDNATGEEDEYYSYDGEPPRKRKKN